MAKSHNRYTTNAGRGRACTPLTFKASDEDRARIDELAAAHKMSRSEWIRHRSMTVGAARKESDGSQ